MPIPTETPTMVLLFNAPDEVAVADAVSAVVVELGGIDTVVVEVRAATVGSSGGADVLLKGSDVMDAVIALEEVGASGESGFRTRQPNKI